MVASDPFLPFFIQWLTSRVVERCRSERVFFQEGIGKDWEGDDVDKDGDPYWKHQYVCMISICEFNRFTLSQFLKNWRLALYIAWVAFISFMFCQTHCSVINSPQLYFLFTSTIRTDIWKKDLVTWRFPYSGVSGVTKGRWDGPMEPFGFPPPENSNHVV